MKRLIRIVAHRHTGRLAAILMADALFFGGSDSKKVASWLLAIGILLVAATFYQLIYCGLACLRLYGLKVKRERRLALLLTGIAGGLLALQSIGELGARDIAVLLPLVAIGYLYSFYGVARRSVN
jgi:hypothetical protein